MNWCFFDRNFLCQSLDLAYCCSELTDLKVHRLLCLQEGLNFRSYSVNVEPILKFVPKLLKATVTFIMSFRLSVGPPTLNNLCSFRQIFVKFNIGLVLENLSTIFKLHLNLKRDISALHDNLCTLLLMSGWILLLIRQDLEKFFEKI